MTSEEARNILVRHDSDDPCGCDDLNRCEYEKAEGFLAGVRWQQVKEALDRVNKKHGALFKKLADFEEESRD